MDAGTSTVTGTVTTTTSVFVTIGNSTEVDTPIDGSSGVAKGVEEATEFWAVDIWETVEDEVAESEAGSGDPVDAPIGVYKVGAGTRAEAVTDAKKFGCRR